MDELALGNGNLKSILECMLFVSPQPLSVKHVADSLELDELEVDRAIHELRLEYAGRGLQIVRVAEGYQMCTRPEFADQISMLLKPQRTRLSRAALETSAIIAYKQPITQPEIDAIRGVNSDGVVKTLVERNLVKQVGRKETVGRPILYATTEEFLNHFGLNSISDLPEIEDIEIKESLDGAGGTYRAEEEVERGSSSNEEMPINDNLCAHIDVSSVSLSDRPTGSTNDQQ